MNCRAVFIGAMVAFAISGAHADVFRCTGAERSTLGGGPALCGDCLSIAFRLALLSPNDWASDTSAGFMDNS